MLDVCFAALVLGTMLPSHVTGTHLPPSGLNYNDGIYLAVTPQCGSYNGNTSDVNHGLPELERFKTIVAFGDSYTTDGKNDGTKPLPAVLTGTSPKAGGRTTNGLTWVEDLAADSKAVIMDYAVGGAVVNVTLWPSKSTADDFVSQVQRFLEQGHDLDPATTLYTSFFGINDYSASKTDGADRLALAAQDYLALVHQLRSGPTNARYWLALDDYGRGSQAASGDAFKGQVFAGLAEMNKHVAHIHKLQYAFVDLKTLWDGVLGVSPGYEAFGYTSSGACTQNSSTTQDACSDPDHTFYWIPGHPSKQTHRLMADYVEQVLYKC